MDQLPDEMRVTDLKRPPLVHFGIPLKDVSIIGEHAKRNGRHPLRIMREVYYLSRKVEYKLEFCRPFRKTADCRAVLELYSNYTMDEKKLVEEDEEDVISMVKDALQLDLSVRPRWYFDWTDPWQPTMEEEARFQLESDEEDTV